MHAARPSGVYVQAKPAQPVSNVLDPIEPIKKVKSILPQLKEALVVSIQGCIAFIYMFGVCWNFICAVIL